MCPVHEALKIMNMNEYILYIKIPQWAMKVGLDGHDWKLAGVQLGDILKHLLAEAALTYTKAVEIYSCRRGGC